MNKISVLAVMLCWLGILLNGCSMSFSPEQAIVQELLTENHMGKTVPESIQILQKRDFDERVLVMVAFQKIQDDGRVDDCIYVFEPARRIGSWRAGGGSGGCRSGPAAKPAVELGAGTSSSDRGAYSYAYGTVNLPEVTTIEVTWDDGEVQKELVINGSFFIYRNAAADIQQLQAFNTDNQVVYLHEDSGPAPGKSLP
jgi:hypothetical protein